MRKCAILLIISTIINMFAGFGVFAADTATVEVDERYEKSINLLSDLGIFPVDKTKAPDSTITRSDFATLLVYLMDIKKYEGGGTTGSNKYTGYNNDPIIDEWTWFDPNAVEEVNSNATPFYDVTKEHPNWENIEAVALCGIMTGDDDRNFSPSRKLTLGEISKILVELNGVKSVNPFEYPNGYYMQALQLGIFKGVNCKAVGEYITYRDLMVALDNFLDIDVYGVYLESLSYSGAKPTYILREGETYMNVMFDIYKVSDIVTENEYTTLNGESALNKNEVKIDGLILSGNKKAKEYLGYDVDAYYITEDESESHTNELLHIVKTKRNTEIIINADDILDYTDSRLSYYDGKNNKSVYIGAKTPIIYNGKLLTSYTDSDITPSTGEIKILDNGRDSDIVFIEAYDTYVVGSIDHDTQIIKNKLNASQSVQADDDTIIRDASGREYSITDISKGSVLSIKESKNTGDKLLEIIISNNIITGVITSIINRDEFSVVINDEKYSLADGVDNSGIVMNEEYDLYLDIFGRIAKYESGVKKMSYGYVVKGSDYEDEGSDKKIVQLRMYLLDTQKIEKLILAKTVRINNKSFKTEKGKEILTDLYTGTSFMRQLVKYSLNDNGEVAELITSKDRNEVVGTGHQLVDISNTKAYGGSRPIYWRNASQDSKGINSDSAYVGDRLPLFSFDGKTKFLNVPEDAANAEDESYYYIKQPDDNTGSKIIGAFADSDKTFKANVVVCLVASAGADNASVNSAFMVKEKLEVLDDDGEEATQLTLVGHTGEKNYYVTQETKSNDSMANINAGDLVKFKSVSSTNEITYLDKVYDADTNLLEKDDAINYQPGKVSYNPIYVDGSANDGTQYIQNYTLAHGKFAGVWGDEETAIIELYNYSDYGVKSGTMKADLWNVSLKEPRIFVYDKSSEMIEDGTKKDLVEGRDVVYCSFWTTGRAIFVYK